MAFSPLLVQLIDALRCMPGIGKKSAQRIAFHLLERDRDGASHLSTALSQAVQGIGHCKRCRTGRRNSGCRCLSSDSRKAASMK
jgi:recombination protein RecR